MTKHLIIVLILVLFETSSVFSNEYEAETLKEVLMNANYRLGPSITAEKLGVIPGGFVISVIPSTESKDWYKFSLSEDLGSNGYIHSSLLADTSTSYKLKEINNGKHLIKDFIPRSDLTNVLPQGHARIYSLDGQFISHFPRLEDLNAFKDVRSIIPYNFSSNAPHYTLSYNTGGNHCCIYNKYVSKSPFGESQFKLNSDIYSVEYNEASNEYEFIANDDTYTYWNYSYASSPIPEVKLKLVDGAFVVSKEMIQVEPPSMDELQELINLQPKLSSELDGVDLDRAIGRLTGSMLKLIYSGHPKSAEKFIDSVWPEQMIINNLNFMDRKQFKSELNNIVKSSPYVQPWMLE